MPFAVTLPLDEAAASEVERLLDALVARTGADDVVGLGYRPHITLAILPETAPPAGIEAATFAVAAGWARFPLVLAGLGVFPGTSPVIWVAPIVTADLLTRHAELHAALAAFDVHAHYAPAAWVPHVTLTKEGAVSAGRAIEAVSSAWRGPINATIDRVELVRFRPVDILRSEALP
ncbi:MAG: 2'-5' RNA ligase family protein [Rhodospirillales bacterium]|nr:2'-5' RNA ligase family protein [Rhodospirillales bacterium]